MPTLDYGYLMGCKTEKQDINITVLNREHKHVYTGTRKILMTSFFTLQATYNTGSPSASSFDVTNSPMTSEASSFPTSFSDAMAAFVNDQGGFVTGDTDFGFDSLHETMNTFQESGTPPSGQVGNYQDGGYTIQGTYMFQSARDDKVAPTTPQGSQGSHTPQSHTPQTPTGPQSGSEFSYPREQTNVSPTPSGGQPDKFSGSLQFQGSQFQNFQEGGFSVAKQQQQQQQQQQTTFIDGQDFSNYPKQSASFSPGFNQSGASTGRFPDQKEQASTFSSSFQGYLSDNRPGFQGFHQPGYFDAPRMPGADTNFNFPVGGAPMYHGDINLQIIRQPYPSSGVSLSVGVGSPMATE